MIANNLIVNGVSRFLNPINGNITGTASNVTGTVAIANGGTGATTAANARTALGLGGAAVKGVTDTYSSTGTDLTTGKAIASALGTLNISLTGVPGSSNTLTAFSQINGKVNATFGSISITKSQISDFPTSMTPTSHTHGNIQNGGTLQTNDITIASGDKLVVTDSSDSAKIARTSVSFDGSTTTKALTPKGTFETFLQSHQDISGKLDKSGGTMTGTIITPADNSKGIRPATNNYGEIGDSSYWYNKTYCKDIYNTRTIVCADQSAISTGRKLVIESDDIYFADGDTRDTWDGTNSYLKTAISSLANRKYIYGSWRETSNKTGTGSSHPTIQSFSFTTTGRPLVIILSAPISVSRYTGSIRLIMDNSGILEASTNSQTMFRATNMIIKTDVAAGTHNFVIDLSAQDAGTTTTIYSYNPYSVMMFEL